MRCLLAAAVAFACMAGCERDRGKAAPRPPSVVVDIARANSHSGDGLKAFMAAVRPMVPVDEAMLLSLASGKLGLVNVDAIDRSAPLHLLVVDDGSSRQLVLVAKIADAKALDEAKTQHATIETRAGWAAIGRDPAAVHDIAPYALSALPDAPAPERPTATVYLGQIVKLHGDRLAQIRDAAVAAQSANGPSAEVVHEYIDGMFAAMQEIDELRVSLDATGDQADVEVLATARPGSKLAAFVAVQRPADFAAIGKLPSDPAAVVGIAKLAAGPYHDANLKLMSSMYGTADFGRLLDVTTGEIAFTLSIGAAGMAMTQLIGITDSHAADAAVAGIAQVLADGRPMSSGRLTQTMRSLPGTTDHDGVAIHSFETTFDASADTASRRHMAEVMVPGGKQSVRVAVLDRSIVYAMGGEADTVIGNLIDTTKGKRAGYVAQPPASRMIDAAAARKDSAIMLIDIAMLRQLGQSTGSAPVAVTFGKAGAQLRLHVSVPAASLRSVM